MEEEIIQYPSYFSSVFSTVFISVENYGWYILICLIIILYLYDKYGKSFITDYKKRVDEAEYAGKYHKNPDLISSRLLAHEKRTLDLQERYKKDAEEHKRKLEEKELKKKEELLQKYENGGHTLGSTSSKSFKPEYNPLTGSGSSSNYKPPKRSACGKGGCG